MLVLGVCTEIGLRPTWNMYVIKICSKFEMKKWTFKHKWMVFIKDLFDSGGLTVLSCISTGSNGEIINQRSTHGQSYLSTNRFRYVTHSHKTRRKSPELFLRYRPINMLQINRKQRHFQEKYWLFIGETLSEYDKWYIILELRISAFSASTNLKKLLCNTYSWFRGSGSHMVQAKYQPSSTVRTTHIHLGPTWKTEKLQIILEPALV